MPRSAKGFTLIELLVTVSLVGIIAAIAMPSFTRMIQNNRAETEVSELQRAFNYARLEAINRGMTIRIAPASGTDWATALQVTDPANAVLRTTLPLTTGATLTNGNVNAIDFNNLGGMITPSSNVTMTYTRGSTSRTLSVCLTGRVVLGSCTDA